MQEAFASFAEWEILKKPLESAVVTVDNPLRSGHGPGYTENSSCQSNGKAAGALPQLMLLHSGSG